MQKSTDTQEPIYYSDQNDTMEKANKNAQDTFKYFWRELYWECRRIIPSLDFAMIKFPFQQELENGEVIVEHMWINDINFDGETISGILVNEPNELTNIENGDAVYKKISDISDWLFAIDKKTYGGFTIQTMRSQMDNEERHDHDNAWGLDFGDYNDILVVHGQKEHPEYLIEHPMSFNMKEKFESFLQENLNELSYLDEKGCTLLHTEAIAGNRTLIEVLLKFGVDKTVTSQSEKTAYTYAKEMNWEHVEDLL